MPVLVANLACRTEPARASAAVAATGPAEAVGHALRGEVGADTRIAAEPRLTGPTGAPAAVATTLDAHTARGAVHAESVQARLSEAAHPAAPTAAVRTAEGALAGGGTGLVGVVAGVRAGEARAAAHDAHEIHLVADVVPEA